MEVNLHLQMNLFVLIITAFRKKLYNLLLIVSTFDQTHETREEKLLNRAKRHDPTSIVAYISYVIKS